MNNDNGSKPKNPSAPQDKNADSTRIMPAVNPSARNTSPSAPRVAGTPSAGQPAVRQDQQGVRMDQQGVRQDQQSVRMDQQGVRQDQQSVRMDQQGVRIGQPNSGAQRPAGQPPRAATPVRPAGTQPVGRAPQPRNPQSGTQGIPQPPRAGNIQQRDGKSLEELDKERRRREKHEDKSFEHGASGIVSSIVKALVYIVLVFGVSIFMAYNAILIGNDVFAFVKPSTVISVEIPEGAELKDITKILEDKGLIKYPAIFELYAKYRERDKDYVPGTYMLSTAQNYDEIMIQMRKSAGNRAIKRLTFKEGITVDEILDIFIQNGMGSKAKFVDVINNFEYDYDFVKELDKGLPEGRKYRLEGYLYPDTYEFFADSSEEAIIAKFLDNFNVKFNETFRTRCKNIGMTIDQAINLSSIIQGEARHPEDFTLISSVFHNRLGNPQFPRLESDATIQYTFAARKPELTADDLKIQSPYNTYLSEGLPPSAINNPGLEAINAALYPETTEYYYFVSDKAGKTYYAKTHDEHLANINTARGQ